MRTMRGTWYGSELMAGECQQLPSCHVCVVVRFQDQLSANNLAADWVAHSAYANVCDPGRAQQDGLHFLRQDLGAADIDHRVLPTAE